MTLTPRILRSLSLVAAVCASASVRADFHIMRISEVQAQAGGDPRIQFLELQMAAAGQTNVVGHRLEFQDARGRPAGTFTIPARVANGANGSTILFGTQAFADATGMQPDFILPEGLLDPFSGRVCFENIDCLAYGDFTGPNPGFGSPAPRFPVSGSRSLTRVGTVAPADNSTDYELRTSSPRRNDGTDLALSVPDPACSVADPLADPDSVDDQSLGAGLDLEACGAAILADVGSPEVLGGLLFVRPGAAPVPGSGIDAPLGLAALSNAVALGIDDQDYRVRFRMRAEPGLATGAVFVRARHLFADGAIDLATASGIGINFSFDNAGETSDHLHADVRGPCLAETTSSTIASADDATYPDFLLASGTEYSVVLDVDGDEASGPLTLQVKLFSSDREEPVGFLGTFHAPSGIAADLSEELEHAVLFAALGSSDAALEVSELSICAIPRTQKQVRLLACARNGDGTVSIDWNNPADADTSSPIRILVDGAQVDSIDGSSTSYVLDDPPAGELAITVVNYSGVGVECVLCENNPPEAIVGAPSEVAFEGGIGTIDLDGSASTDGDGGIQTLTFLWEIVSFPAAGSPSVSDPLAAVTSLVVDAPGEYAVRLTVTDSGCPGSPPLATSAEHTIGVNEVGEDRLLLRSDCNDDGKGDISDAIFGLNFLFAGGAQPVCSEACNSNSDDKHDISDAIFFLNFLFLGGPTVEPPYPDCGVAAPGIGCDTTSCR